MGPAALLPIRRKVCYGFLLPLKIHRLGRVWSRDPWVQWQAHESLLHRGDKSELNTRQPITIYNIIPFCTGVELGVSLWRGDHSLMTPESKALRGIFWPKRDDSWTRWPRGLRRRSATAWFLESRVRIQLRSWMFVSCVYMLCCSV
jgi:hypothetical protein